MASLTGRCDAILPPICGGRSLRTKASIRLPSRRKKLPALLRAIDGYGEVGDKLTGYALRLLVLTFVRTMS
jgi:hypothetical protein